ncbi:Rieske (2Fe-2S) protein [Mesorhizobium sp. B2-1-8]|uniref:Rieske (2Fe-2S) protein n=1 Tax=unclassified Mesorhizobium TaxID=325217 RepID=UPI00112ACEE0|nr:MULTISPECIES: Rieske (2Fe-2S) protein [unclassified Mesorhizobium]MBZ9706750.1 Rieske (2Fe-2S) protein [Mesorhizobium sp. ESP7-2]UCI18226.1 Rieske (2Fe-2S) protein [Mesorhizobium sp. B2-1-8]
MMEAAVAPSRTFACKVAEVTTERPKIVTFGRISVGIFELHDGYAALLNICPHRAGQLCEGPVCGTTRQTNKTEFVYERAGELVRCAWHGWEFEIRSGKCLVDDRLKARTFPVHRDGEDLYVELGR